MPLNNVTFVLRFLLRLLISIFLLLVILIGLQYATTTIYEFEEPKPFSGQQWLNPYQEIDSTRIKANFHAHSCAWKSVSRGSNSAEKMASCYKEKKYDIAAISNYFCIDTVGKRNNPLYVPVYEHGLNIFKSHCLVLNAQKVSYYDYFLFQTTSHQQKVIENIKANDGIVAIAHPKFCGGRSLKDMKYLMHYDLVEVLNHYRISDTYWDEALSAGRLAYLVANDDSHSIETDETERTWTVIFSKKKTRKAALKSLLSGKAFGVYTEYNKCKNNFEKCQLSEDRLTVKFAIPADTIFFIGQGGSVKYRVIKSDHASYKLKTNDTYIRIVAKNYESAIYLNPVIRYDTKVPYNSLKVPKEKMLQTGLFRAFVIGILYFPFRWLWRIWRPKRKGRNRLSFSKPPILFQP
ncbi:PHP domain-containing protein [Fluviicola sp.]|uniref:PHP domain-containing protein n=1 Tax=Fluviicola sp. TaxID=1917219 RepID=UPI003D2B0C13